MNESDASARNSERTQAAVLLVLANVCWGWSFPTMKWVVPEMQKVASGAGELAVTATFIGWRFGFAAALYLGLSLFKQRGHTRTEVVGGIATGLCFVTGLFLQITGLRYTLPSISGFLTSLVVVFIPIAQRLVQRKATSAGTWPAVALALVGLVVLAGTGDGDVAAHPPFPFCGEVFTILGSMAFTAQVLFLDHFGQKAKAERLSLIQFATVGVVGLGLGALLDGGVSLYHEDVLRALGSNWTFRWGMPSVVVICTVAAFHLMNLNQPKLPASTAGVIYCTEPVFATLFSIVLGAEVLRLNLLIGGGLILAAILWVNWPARRGRESAISAG
ncbi:MAG: DMT family transporter [Planctomycetes bacterium]|nr:DMT family transporter [Planctomycetota bacterium]